MSKRILVVEDQEDLRAILRDFLSASGYTVIEADDGAESVAKAASKPPGSCCDGVGGLMAEMSSARRIAATRCVGCVTHRLVLPSASPMSTTRRDLSAAKRKHGLAPIQLLTVEVDHHCGPPFGPPNQFHNRILFLSSPGATGA
jgi:CheY-like chemotaxis protein